MPQNPRILCRELSLLAFNRRVLAQANNPDIPLLERLKYLCIVSSNLDEFFEVRVARLKREARTTPDLVYDSGNTPAQTIEAVSREAHQLIAEQYHLFNDILLPELAQENIVFYRRSRWTAEQSRWIEEYFDKKLLPILTPISLDVSHPFPRLLNKSLNFIVEFEGEDAFKRHVSKGIVQAPRILPRLVKLPEHLCDGKDGFVFLSSILHKHVGKLFRGMNILGCHQFRLTRDSALMVDEEDITNLRNALSSELQERDYGDGVRLEISDQCPEHMANFLLKQFKLESYESYQVEGPVNLVRLMALPEMVNRPDLKFPPYEAQTPKFLKKNVSMLDVIQKNDILLHHPYQSFEPVVRFIHDAANDPNVVAIKMTIYRTGSNSDLARALMTAARAGKQVTVVVELMARFDEANNINWADKLEEAGAHVVYGVMHYKIHAKMALVIREEHGELKRYAHLGTGNYHQATSRFYTDFGFLTTDPDITADVNDLFMMITGAGQAKPLKKLYSSPHQLHPMIIEAIDREIQNARAGLPAKMMAKMNSLIEPLVIEKLYEASSAGVQIDLIVRGMCALRPQVAGLSENIRVRSIIGRLLEHSRVYYFYDNGKENVFISSADFMGRNFFSRIETATPITQTDLKKRVLEEGLLLPLADNVNAWQMDGNGVYHTVSPEDNQEKIGLQNSLLNQYAHFLK